MKISMGKAFSVFIFWRKVEGGYYGKDVVDYS